MTVAELMKRPYHIELVRSESPSGIVGWVASVVELPGCLTQGDTPEEAAYRIQDAMEAWVEMSLEQGWDIPDPIDDEKWSRAVRAA